MIETNSEFVARMIAATIPNKSFDRKLGTKLPDVDADDSAEKHVVPTALEKTPLQVIGDLQQCKSNQHLDWRVKNILEYCKSEM